MTESCRYCAKPLTRVLVDLGKTALANSYVTPGTPAPDPAYELCARVCDDCFLVQVADAVPADAIFSDYAYFSSFSTSWLAHCEAYAETMTARFGLGPQSRVVEIASNDGYLLQYFVKRGVPVLGVEPAANVAEVARANGVPTDVAFFGKATGERLRASGITADLMASNNVLAHVPDINGFVAGVPLVLKPEGVWTIEFPHLLNLIRLVQFDTIYHEHYSYLSLLFVERLLASHGLRVFDVETYPTHGGSLRVFCCHAGASHAPTAGLAAIRAQEAAAGLDTPAAYDDFGPRVVKVRDDLLAFLRKAKAEGKSVAAYGAAAKGNTLLNYCGIGTGLIAYVVDKNPAKQDKLSPGSRVPIHGVERLYETRPDYIVILPWNVRDEVVAQNPGVREWGAQWVTAIPELRVFLMRIERLALQDAALIRLDRKADSRGWFARSFCMDSFAAAGLHAHYPQHNISFNHKAGTVRGLHFQIAPHEEVKVISCTRGAILDVLVDLRPDSPTYGQWHAAELSEDNRDALYAPAGFAHGFQTLRDDTEVSYLMGASFVDGASGGLRYDDPRLAIPWPLPVSVISERDLALPTLPPI